MILEEIYNLGKQLGMYVEFSSIEASYDSGRCEPTIALQGYKRTPDLAVEANDRCKGFTEYIPGIFAVLSDTTGKDLIIPVDGYEYPFE